MHMSLTRYLNEGPSMARAEGQHTPKALWVEGIGPHTPVRRNFRGAVKKTLFEDCAPSASCHPPLVLSTAIITITLHGNCCHLGNQKERYGLKQKIILGRAERWRILGQHVTSVLIREGFYVRAFEVITL